MMGALNSIQTAMRIFELMKDLNTCYDKLFCRKAYIALIIKFAKTK